VNDKQTGSFYTPKSLVNFMCNYALQRSNAITVLEPSVGDGRFIDKLTKYDCNIDAVEIDENKIAKLSRRKKNNVQLICENFIEFSLASSKEYDLIIGNPPYITKKKLSEKDRNSSLELIKYWSLPESIFQNLWVSFVLGALKLLNSANGAIFFVLPFEFLQVHYAEKLRGFLEARFNNIEIITFKDSVFPDIEQDVCLVYMSNCYEQDPIVKYTTVQSAKNFKPLEYSEIKRNKPLTKWSNSILSDDEIELLKTMSNKYTSVSRLGSISPGIVTGANSFFILNKSDVEKLNCQDKVIPIIQKGTSINNMLIFSEEDSCTLLESEKRALMLNLNGIDPSVFSAELQDYINDGERNNLNTRYKCGQRKRWYDVPVILSGNLMFFKRYNRLPRLLVNESGIYTTDISYNVRLSEEFDAPSVAFCFYNSLTITLCEYNGRFYGGGVGELVPSEFKSLCIPYKKIDKNDIDRLDHMLRQNAPVEEIFQYVDNVVLDALNNDDLSKLKRIREKYLMRRLKEEIN
jgi:adenine-specific DNA-methyltransferase